VRSLGRAEDGQPKFRRLVSQSGKPIRLQQSIKLCDRDEEHKTKNSLAVLILAQRLDQQIDSWEADADKADGTEELCPCGDMPVANFFETVFLPYVQANKEASTARSYQSYWNAYLRDHFNGTKTLKNYQPYQGTNLIEKLAKEYSENTINHVRALASAIFSYACAKGYIQYNPWRDVKKTSDGQDVDEGYAYDQREVEQILDTLEHVQGRETYSAQMAGMAVTLGFYAGLRPSETAGLRWENISLNDNRIAIKQAYVSGDLKGTKTGKDRYINMLPALAHRMRLWAMVQGHPTTGWLLPNRSGEKPVVMNDLSARIIGPALKKVGMEWHSFYALRRGGITAMVLAGGTLEEVADFAGNSPDVIYQHYFKDKESKLAARGMAKWAAALNGQIGHIRKGAPQLQEQNQ
jgi:integrase